VNTLGGPWNIVLDEGDTLHAAMAEELGKISPVVEALDIHLRNG